VLRNDLERQADRFAAVLHERQEQAGGVVELGSMVSGARELLHVGRAEVVAFDRRADLLQLGSKRPGVQAFVGEKTHRVSP